MWLSPSFNHLREAVRSFAAIEQTPISIRHLVKHGAQPSKKALLLSSQFVHNELPIRLARRVRELKRLPYGLPSMPAIQRLSDHYLTSLDELLNFPPMSIALPGTDPHKRLLDYTLGATQTKQMFRKTDLRQLSESLGEVLSDPAALANYEYARDNFIELLLGIQARHDNDLVIMANGIQQLRRGLRENDMPDNLDLQSWLDPFYRGRIGIRLLLGHHIALSSGSQEGHIGMVAPHCRIGDVIERAANHARYICVQTYPMVVPPKVVIAGDASVTFPYVPSVLYYICFELVKNALRATVEHQHLRHQRDCPDVAVLIAGGGGEVTVKIADQGGGIPRSLMPRLWSYAHTTASPQLPQLRYSTKPLPMAGFGYGLPMSRLYARYFGGDLQLMPLAGHGVDAYIYLNRIGDVVEVLE